MNLEDELNECLKKKSEITKKRGRLIVFDKLATSAGVISVCALPINLVALIPLGAAVGLGVYINKKDEETFNEMCDINFKCGKLENEIAYKKVLEKS